MIGTQSQAHIDVDEQADIAGAFRILVDVLDQVEPEHFRCEIGDKGCNVKDVRNLVVNDLVQTS